MDLNEYQERASRTAVYREEDTIVYPALGLASEVGEVTGKVKKVLRDNEGIFSKELCDKIGDEMGDVLWYIAALCRDLNIKMNDIAERNLNKLEDRKNRNVLQGSGDTR